MGRIEPTDISESFVRHIREVENRKTALSCYGVGLLGTDYCVDIYDVDGNGHKEGCCGAVVAGASLRRIVKYNNVGLESPREFMEKLLEESGGVGVNVAMGFHLYCGFLFVRGMMTKSEQARASFEAYQVWYDAWQHLKPHDKELVSLDQRVTQRGSAPVVDFVRAKIQIVNQDYVTSVINKFPINTDLYKDLAPETKAVLEIREEGVVNKNKPRSVSQKV